MSKRTSKDLSNVLEVANRNDLADGCDDTELSECSKEPDSKESAAVGGGDDFMHTDDFRRLFVGFAMIDTLVAMRWLDKKWHKVVEKKLIELENQPFGEIFVHGGNDLSNNPKLYPNSYAPSYEEADSDVREYISLKEAKSAARRGRMEQVKKVVFLLNITKVGNLVCVYASNLVVVDIPEGITIIGGSSFSCCYSLKDIKFPKSLTSIGSQSFFHCSSLERVDLLHTNVQYLGEAAFGSCESLREMKVPDSLQTFGDLVFLFCSKLVPSDIEYYDNDAIVAHLRSVRRSKRKNKGVKKSQNIY
ncbi:hypothetical protein TrST_g9999 [Triparma strigata]|uniref:Uncharacterized protein n=1 Tax=Triparma strigata TaxID=1606541 RepID=A0A9W7BGA8_9STRA|nr:hypothetical protein TrST_g9999 [Triparma strigata]